MSEPIWVTIARRYLGVKEGPGKVNNPTVVGFFGLAGHPEIKQDLVAWCAAFISAVLHMAGLKGTGTLWALDYAKWGQKLKGPAIGAIATKKRVGGGHVFLVVGWDDKHVYGLGGNQSDQVSIVAFNRGDIHSYTWPAEVALPGPQPKTLVVARAEKAGSEA
jgi:uncharacterized protein (TIGR02594 family)